MSFQTGRDKTGGRAKGTRNKTTKCIRDLLKELLTREFQGIHKYLDELTPKERLDVLIKLCPYVLPQIDKVQVTMDSDDYESIWIS